MAKETYQHECKTYLRIIANRRYLDDIKGVIAQFTPCREGKNSLVVGENEDYDVDVNVMIRQTIKDLLGKEEELLALQKKYPVRIYLVVVPQIMADSDVPRQILSLEEDVIEFLYKAGVKYDLDYYII